MIDEKRRTEEQHEFVDALRRHMKRTGITQARLSDLTGISRVTISSILTGKIGVSYTKAVKISKALRVSLLSREGDILGEKAASVDAVVLFVRMIKTVKANKALSAQIKWAVGEILDESQDREYRKAVAYSLASTILEDHLDDSRPTHQTAAP